ncbi:MAG: HEPN domain-containing protein [Bacteroidales bacterium]|jgi:uncharacterized protein (UPF0332 family)|nr:HEPN domain-containing protein [Bacteroidales bacterium]
MGLNDIDREELVRYRLENAKATLTEVSVLIENKFYRTAANRLYYACYYAAMALFVNDGYEAHTHSGVKSLLNQYYFNQGKIDKSLGKMYGQVFNMRMTGDYEDLINFNENDIKPFIAPAGEFIATIEKLISLSHKKHN